MNHFPPEDQDETENLHPPLWAQKLHELGRNVSYAKEPWDGPTLAVLGYILKELAQSIS